MRMTSPPCVDWYNTFLLDRRAGEFLMPFSKLGLHASLVQAVRDMRYTEPTPVQAEAIPASPRRPRPDRHRPDRHRQNRRLPAAHPAPSCFPARKTSRKR